VGWATTTDTSASVAVVGASKSVDVGIGRELGPVNDGGAEAGWNDSIHFLFYAVTFFCFCF